MMEQLFTFYRSKCEKAVVDDMVRHPRVRELMG